MDATSGGRRVVFRHLMQAGRGIDRTQLAREMASPVTADVDGLFVAGCDAAQRFLRDPSAEAGMAVAARLWAKRDADAPLAPSVAHGFPPYMEPELHRVMRPVLAAAIARIDEAAHRSLIGEKVGQSLAEGVAVEVRLLDDLLAPVLQRWLMELLGEELQRWPEVQIVAEQVPALIDVTARRRDLATVSQAGASMLEAKDQFLAAVARCPNRHIADLPRTVGKAGGQSADSDEVALRTLGTIGFLQSASSDTTIVMAAEVIALLAEQDTWSSLKSYALSVEQLTAEALRLSSPIRVSARRTSCPVDLGTARVPAGEVVFVALGATNWQVPSFLSDDRRLPHMAFGHGPHFCPGWRPATAVGEALVRSILSSCSRPPVVVRVHRGAHRCIAEHIVDVTVALRP